MCKRVWGTILWEGREFTTPKQNSDVTTLNPSRRKRYVGLKTKSQFRRNIRSFLPYFSVSFFFIIRPLEKSASDRREWHLSPASSWLLRETFLRCQLGEANAWSGGCWRWYGHFRWLLYLYGHAPIDAARLKITNSIKYLWVKGGRLFFLRFLSFYFLE